MIGLLIYSVFFVLAPWFAAGTATLVHRPVRVSAISFILAPVFEPAERLADREMQFKQRTVINLLSVTLAAGVVALACRVRVWSSYSAGLPVRLSYRRAN